MKFTSKDIIAVLKKFEAAPDDIVSRDISRVTYSQPIRDHSTAISFAYGNNTFYVLIDSSANDNASYVVNELRRIGASESGTLLPNPTEHSMMHGIPYRGKDVYLYHIEYTKIRLDSYLATDRPEYSRSTWQKFIRAGEVLVNDISITTPNHMIKPTDTVRAEISPPNLKHVAIPLLYSDNDVIVVNKPAGVLTHAKGVLHDEYTTADFFRPLTTYNTSSVRPGIVHRLDRDTSGVLLGARHEQAAEYIKKQFADRSVRKSYIAILVGHAKQKQARIDLPIARSMSHPSQFCVDPSGKSATTDYTVLAESDTYTLIKLTPHTGRTHQLRVHMKYIGTPILGDSLYGKNSDRLYLHAHSLHLQLPSGKSHTFIAPLPQEFQRLFDTRGIA